MSAVSSADAAKLAARAKRTALEDMLAGQIAAHGLPTPRREFRFHPVRKWRFDLAWPEHMLAVEVDGGTWSGGRHTTGAGYQRDVEKFNAAGLAGWTVLHFTAADVRSGWACTYTATALQVSRP
ncbi:MAG: endonuclease domain-containing protein [Thermoleophilia bacterium]